MVMRLVARHLRDQKFEVVGHTLRPKLHGMRRRDERSGEHAYIKDVEKYSMSTGRQPTEKGRALIFSTDRSFSVHSLAAGSLWHRTTARPLSAASMIAAVLLRITWYPAAFRCGGCAT